MIIRLTDYLDRPALIEQQQKQQHLKITPIGGPKEIIEWRAKQAAKLAELDLKRGKLKETVSEHLAGGADAPLGELTWQGKALLSDQKAWADKLAEAKFRRKKLFSREPVLVLEPELPKIIETEPKLTMFQRFKAWVSKSFV